MPNEDPEILFQEVLDFVNNNIIPEMTAISEQSGFNWEELTGIPSLSIEEDADLSQLTKSLTGANQTETVSFGTEAGLFQIADIPTIVCGPGDIEQAHKPNEFISLEQVSEGEAFIRRLMDHICS